MSPGPSHTDPALLGRAVVANGSVEEGVSESIGLKRLGSAAATTTSQRPALAASLTLKPVMNGHSICESSSSILPTRPANLKVSWALVSTSPGQEI